MLLPHNTGRHVSAKCKGGSPHGCCCERVARIRRISRRYNSDNQVIITNPDRRFSLIRRLSIKRAAFPYFYIYHRSETVSTPVNPFDTHASIFAEGSWPILESLRARALRALKNNRFRFLAVCCTKIVFALVQIVEKYT